MHLFQMCRSSVCGYGSGMGTHPYAKEHEDTPIASWRPARQERGPDEASHNIRFCTPKPRIRPTETAPPPVRPIRGVTTCINFSVI